MSLKPLNDRVIVERIDTVTRTPGGLLIPETAQEKPVLGNVVATSNSSVNINDIVLFGRHAGIEVKDDGKTLLILKVEELLAIKN
jgi:chaperonin GroES